MNKITADSIKNIPAHVLAELVNLAVERAPVPAAEILLGGYFTVMPAVKEYRMTKRDHQLLREIIEASIVGQRVTAIKSLRMLTGMGLKEARDTMIAFENRTTVATEDTKSLDVRAVKMMLRYIETAGAAFEVIGG